MLDITATLLITLVNIAELYLILKRILFKPVSAVMADRAKRLETKIREANQAKERADLPRSRGRSWKADWNS